MNPFQWFLDNLAKMPKWVQVTTWFLLLVLTFYFYLAPRFVNGHAVVQLMEGGFIDYRGATIRTHVEGRVFKFKSNEDGYWSVPVVSRMPQDLRLEIYHEDKKAWYEARVAASTVWKSAFGTTDVKLVLDSGDKPVTIVVTEASSAVNRFVTALLSAFEGTAHAQGHLTMERIGIRTRELTAGLLSRIPQDVPADLKLAGTVELTYTQKIQIIHAVEEEFKIQIPDEEWRQMPTLADLADYVFKHQQ
jgi:acyl carrier protein